MPNTINDKLGNERMLGCLPRVTKVGDGTFKVFGETDDTPPLMTDAELEEFVHVDLKGLHYHTIDQKSQGTCCACMGAGLTMLCREMAGLARIIMSQASLYAFDGIDSRGNPIPRRSDNGMAIDTCLLLLKHIGVAPVSVIDQYDWEGYRQGRWPKDWREHSRKNRILEAWDAPSARHLLSGIAHGCAGGYGLRGHAVIRIGPKDDLNSWGTGYGINGIGQWAKNIPDLDDGIKRYGAWLARVLTDPTDDGDLPMVS